MKSEGPNHALLLVAAVITCATWSSAILLLRLDEKAFAISVWGLGVSLGPCLVAYALVPVARKQAARRWVLFTGGLSIMAFSVLSAANVDLEGFFMLLFAGTMGAGVGQTLVTVILGPCFSAASCAAGAVGGPWFWNSSPFAAAQAGAEEGGIFSLSPV